MKRIIGLTAAAVLVLLQVGVFAVWSLDEAMDQTPGDGPHLVADHRA
jgi:hypothetical protein